MKSKGAISKTTFINSKVTSAISVSLVLFLLGLILILSLFANNISIYVKENMSFSIVLSEDMKDVDIMKLQKKIEAAPYAKSTTYISKEKAAEEVKQDLGEDPEKFLGYNPFQASIEVKLNSEYANSDSIAKIENQLKQNTNINNIIYRKNLLDSVNKNIKNIGFILLILAGLLLVISFALINNTIRLMIYSKRFLIHTMKLVGATNSFIRKPFILSNIVTGIIAAIIAIGMLVGLLYYVSSGLSIFSEIINPDLIFIIFGIVLIFGVLISIIATFFAVNKYLRIKGGDLYHI